MHSGFMLVSMYILANVFVIAHCSNSTWPQWLQMKWSFKWVQTFVYIRLRSANIFISDHFSMFFLFISSSGCFLFQFSPMIWTDFTFKLLIQQSTHADSPTTISITNRSWHGLISRISLVLGFWCYWHLFPGGVKLKVCRLGVSNEGFKWTGISQEPKNFQNSGGDWPGVR